MGLHLFGNSPIRCETGRLASGDPDPKKFFVESVHICGKFTIAYVRYPGCTAFESLKVLVFDGIVPNQVLEAKVLDPHFGINRLSPIARFAASERGKKLAYQFCLSASKE